MTTLKSDTLDRYPFSVRPSRYVIVAVTSLPVRGDQPESRLSSIMFCSIFGSGYLLAMCARFAAALGWPSTTAWHEEHRPIEPLKNVLPSAGSPTTIDSSW